MRAAKVQASFLRLITACMSERRFSPDAQTFAARIGDKYQIRLTRSICFLVNSSAGDVCKILVIYCCYYCLTFNAV